MKNFIKSVIHILLIVLVFQIQLKAQNVITIGSGTNTYAYAPAYSWYNYSFSRMLYLSSDMQALSSGGKITHIAFYISTPQSGYTLTNQYVYMRGTSVTTESTGYIDPTLTSNGCTFVWSGSVNVSSAGWVTIALTTPFNLNPGQNLEIFWNNMHGSYFSTVYWQSTGVSYNAVSRGYSDNSFASATTSSLATATERPNIQITYQPIGRSAAVTEITSPASYIILGSPLLAQAKIANKGVDTITSCRVNWKVNNVLYAPIYDSTLLVGGNTPITINLGNYVCDSDAFNNITVWVDNAMPYDSIQTDDTLSLDFYTCSYQFNGVYTVGGPTADYATLEEVLTHLRYCGVSGPTTFRLNSGTYSIPIALTGAIPGISSTNTVTFTSTAQDADSVKIQPIGTAVELSSACHLRFTYLTLGTTSSTTANGVQFINGANDIDFYGCNINSYVFATSSTYAPVYYNGTSGSGYKLEDVSFIKNKLNGGYSSMYLYYAGSGSGTNMSSITIDSNIMTNAYYYGVRFYYYTYCPSFSHNIISMRGSTTNNYVVCFEGSYNTIDTMEGNKISFGTSSSRYGFYIGSYLNNGSSYNASGPAYIANNEIISTAGTYNYGIYFAGSYPNADVVFNSVYVAGTSTSYAIYIPAMSSSYALKVKNNMFFTNGTGTAYPLYASSLDYVKSSYGTILDYNNYYSNQNVVAYIVAPVANVKALQLITGQDANSVSLNPVFTNLPQDLHTGGTLMVVPVDRATVRDLDGDDRVIYTNMGCYHDYVSSLRNDVELTSMVSPVNWQEMNQDLPLDVVITNYAKDTLKTVRIYWSINNGALKYLDYACNLAWFEQSAAIRLDTVLFTNRLNSILIYTANPNGLSDANTQNDTLHAEIISCDALSGNYTVGGSHADFVSLNDVVNYLNNCGVDGPTTFVLNTGVYNQPMALSGNIPGISATNTVSFTSAAQHPDSVKIYTDGTTLELNAAKHLRFTYLTFGSLGSTSTYGVQFLNGALDIDFYACNINAYLLSTSSSYCPVYYYGSSGSGYKLEDVTFIKNKLNGGYASMYFYYAGSGSDTNMCNVVIDSNIMNNAYYYGVRFYYYSYCPSFSYNTINMRESSTTNYVVCFEGNYNTIDRMVGNKIRFANTGSRYGMYLGSYLNESSLYRASGPAYIANNEILSTGGSANYGIYFSGSYANARILHNSIYMSGTSTSYGIRIPTMSSSYLFSVMNNVFALSTTSTAYPLYASSSDYVKQSFGVTLDNNNYYSASGTYVAYAGGTRSTVADLQSVSMQDVNSINRDPQFINPSVDLHTLSSSMLMPVDTAVVVDIDGKARTLYTNRGCYHDYVAYPVDVALTSISSPTAMAVANQNVALNVSISNRGTDTLRSVRFYWILNKGAVDSLDYNCLLGFLDNSNVITLDSILLNGGTNHITVFTAYPNGLTDANTMNDTLTIESFTCDTMLNGIYVVGPGGDFDNEEVAFNTLLSCGINGPVEMKFMPFTSGSLNLNVNIPGADSINTVTFSSLSGNPSDVKIVSSGGNALTLNGVSNYIFKNITIDATAGTNAVEFINSCSNIMFYGCNIMANPTTTSSSYTAVRYYQSSGISTYLSNVSFIKNKISGGYHNMYFYYACGSSSYMAQSSIRIDSNELTEAYYYGIYAYYYGNYKSVSYNKVTSRTTSSTFYAIYFNMYNTVQEGVIGNCILLQNTSTGYGIRTYYINRSTAYAAQGNALIANNEVIGFAGGSTYGIYTQYSNADFYNNSVYLGGSSTCYVLYISSTSSTYSMNFKNNLFITTTSSTGYPIYTGTANYVTPSYGTVLDYNNYYSTGSYVGYIAGTISTLAALKTATQQDANSVNIQPVLLDINKGLELGSYNGLSCLRINGVNADIRNNVRDSIAYMGCYEPYTLDMAVLAGTTPLSINTLQPVYISGKIKNLGLNTITSANLNLSVNGTITKVIPWTGSLSPGAEILVNIDTTMLNRGNNKIIIWISNPNGSSDLNHSNDTLVQNIYGCDSALNGIYTIGAAASDYASFNDALQALMQCGVNGPVMFVVDSGSYNENVIINTASIQGLSAINTITFTSASANPADVVLGSNTGSMGSALILNNAKHITFKNLTIGLNTGNTGVAVELLGMCENILFTGCVIQTYDQATSSAYCGVKYYSASGSTNYLKNVRFINNHIDGGYYNFWFYYPAGSSTYMNDNAMMVNIDSNIMSNSYYAGFYTYYYGNYGSISYNTISSRISDYVGIDWYGIYTYEYTNIDYIVGNKIRNINANIKQPRGIYIYYDFNYSSYSGSGQGLIANNEILLYGGNTTTNYQYFTGLYIYMPYAKTNILHNNIHLYGANPSTLTGAALYAYNSNSTYQLNIKNNILSTAVIGNVTPFLMPYYVSSITYTLPNYIISDYNNYYNAASDKIVYASSDITLASLRSANMQDANSTDKNPQLNAFPVNLMPSNWIVCPKDNNVLFDINGNMRQAITYSGCYVSNYGTDAGVVEFVGLSELITAGTNNLFVRINNFGNTVLTSVNLHATVDGVSLPVVNVTGLSLLQNQDTVINVGTFVSTLNVSSVIKAWTSNPNGLVDQNHSNDTLMTVTTGCVQVLAGVYDVAGGNNHFATIDDAMGALQNCGVSGPVVFRLATGVYPTLNVVGTYLGVNDINTVTFTSMTANAKDVQIGNLSGVSLTISNASHLRFENVTIGNSSSTYGVQFVNNNEDIILYQCDINSTPGISSSSYAGIYYYNSSSSTNTLKNVRIVKNNISGGYANIYFYYPGGSSSNMVNMSVTIDSNTMTNAYTYGLYSYYYARYESISHNKIVTANISSTQYGLYLYYYHTINNGVVGNSIRILSTSSAYGIYTYGYLNYNSSYGAFANALIANNEIIKPQGTSTTYGLYTYYANVNMYNNTVYLGGTSTCYGYYINTTSSTYSMNIKNNIFVTATTGTGYPIYTGTANYATTAYGTVLDYNNYYSTGTYVGYIAGAKSTINDLRTSTGQDQHSVNLIMNVSDINTGLQLSSYAGISCLKIAGVDVDILNHTRDSITFMGCYVSDSLDAAITADNVNSATTQLPFTVTGVIVNKGLTPLTNAMITWSFKDTVRTSTLWTGYLDQGETDTLNIGTVQLTYGNVNKVKIWVSYPNASTDENTKNDTVMYTVFGCYGPLSGNYTIGGVNANFATIEEAIDPMLNCGIVGPVTFFLNNGTYNENLVFDMQIPGASILNPVTFTSASGIAANVVIGGNQKKEATALTIQNVSHLKFINLTIGLNSEYTGAAVELKGMCENILFKGCTIQTYVQGNSASYCGVKYYSTNGATDYLKNVRFIGNHVDGGYYNFYFNYAAGSSNNMGSNAMTVTIDSNVLSNSYYAGMYSYYYANYPSISYNTITSRTSTNVNADWYGLYIYYYNNVEKIVGNRIYSTNAAITYPRGIYVYYYFNYTSYNGLGKGLIANNEIILHGANTGADFNYFTGIYMYYPYSNMNILHNSIYLYGTDSNTMAGSGIFAYNSTTAYQITIKNNDIATFKAGSSLSYLYPYYISSATYANASYIVTDYNNYYNDKNSNIAFTGIEHTITSLRDVNLQDYNSCSINPGYLTNPVTLVPQNWSTCLVSNEVVNDINGDLRLGRITYKGCYTAIFSNDAGITEIVGLGERVTAGTNNLQVRVYNFGTSTLNSVTVHASVNGVMLPATNLTGLNLAKYQDTVVSIGTFVAFVDSVSHIVAWTSNPNGIVDQNLINDTLDKLTTGCYQVLAGTYDIAGGNNDFATLDDALQVLYNCGVSGPVILRIANGNYPVLDTLGSYFGTSDVNTVTFTSLSGNANSVILGDTINTALTFVNAKHLHFEKVTIGNVMSMRGVEFVNTNEDISFYQCNINSSPGMSSSSYAGIYFYNSSSSIHTLKNVRIVKNNISGGYANIYFYYPGASQTTMLEMSVTIDSNMMTNAYYTGLYSYYYSKYKSFSYNTIITSATSSTQYGMYLYYYNTFEDGVIGNRIRLQTTSSGYGMYTYYTNRSAAYGAKGNALIANNEIIKPQGTSSAYGFYNYYGNVDFINNSIYLAGTSSCYGIYAGTMSSSYSRSLLNNNVMTNTSSTANYPIYYSSADYAKTSYGNIADYNNYYGTGAYVGYVGSAISTMAALRQTTLQDNHSVSVVPQYIDITQSLEMTSYSGMICNMHTSVLQDINGQTRTRITPMGAYSVLIYEGYDLGIMAIVEPVNTSDVFCYQDFASVRIEMQNNGSYPIDFSAQPVSIHLDVSGTVSFQMDTMFLVGGLTQTEKAVYTLTDFLTVTDNGIYHIKAWLSLDADTLYFDDTLQYDYLIDKIILPYGVNFDSIPNGLVFKQISGTSKWSVEPGDGINPTISPSHGTGRLQFNSAVDRGSLASVTLQPINLRGTVSPKLEFWYAHDNAPGRDYTDVQISIDGGFTYNSLLNVKRSNANYPTPTFVRYEVDLTPYTSYSCVIISFEGGSFGGGNQNIDSISITSLQDLLVGVDVIPQDSMIACELTNKVLAVSLTNLTSQDFRFVRNPSEIYVEVTGAVTKNYTYPLTSGIVNGDSIGVFVVDSNFDFSTNGTYNIKAILKQTDDNILNDTAYDTRLVDVDASVVSIDPIGAKKIGERVYPTITVKNIGNIPIRNIPLRLQINYTGDITETINTLLLPGDSITHTFVTPYYVPVVSEMQPFYLLEFTAQVACDGKSNNNKKSSYCQVNFDEYVDLKIMSVQKPDPNVCDTGQTMVYPILLIKNNGNSTANDIALYVTVDSAGTILKSYSESISVLAAGDSVEFTSKTGYLVPNFDNTYKVTLLVNSSDESNPSDNTVDIIACAKHDGTGINSLGKTNWVMGQNIPNPAKVITQIPYTIPTNGDLIVKVISISGQVLYQENIKALAGDNFLEIKLDNLSNGIYYYSMEYQGQRIVKKMTIQR